MQVTRLLQSLGELGVDVVLTIPAEGVVGADGALGEARDG